MPTYDPKLARRHSKGVGYEKPFPPLWAQFDALARAGDGDPRRQFGHSVCRHGQGDALRARRATLETLGVPDQGHARKLAKPDTNGAHCRVRCELRLIFNLNSMLPAFGHAGGRCYISL